MTPTEFKEARLDLGLSQAEMGAVLNVEDRTVRRWEANEIAIPATVGMLVTMIREAMATYRLQLAEYGRPDAVRLAKKPSGPEKIATEAIASLLRKAGIKVDIL